MRRFLFIILPLALALPASAKPRRTVVDYFKMLPSKRFFGEWQHPLGSRLRMEYLRSGFAPIIPADNRSVVDLKNDFLQFPGDGAQDRLDVAVFRFHGQDTVAVATASSDTYSLSFWREQNGRLKEVTKKAFPFYFPFHLSEADEVAFAVPRYRTTIRILETGRNAQPTSKVFAHFQWRGGRFVRA